MEGLEFNGFEDEDKIEVVIVQAKDWCYHASEQRPRTDEYPSIDCFICGMLIHEDDDVVVIAHHWFPDQDEVRHVSTITKSTIVEMYRFSLEDIEAETF
jgi:hypothetical protein